MKSPTTAVVKYTDGGERNTVPDFTQSADLMSPNNKKVSSVSNAIWYEIKATNKIYLSSNTYQLRGHLQNLAVKFAPEMIAYKKYNFKPMLVVVTTNEVLNIDSLITTAALLNVKLLHMVGYYKYEKGVYSFQFRDKSDTGQLK